MEGQGPDPFRPSFFELVAQERLTMGIKPALAHVLNVMAERMPRFRTLASYSDELFFTLRYLLERHYLREYSGSFAENFYGLKRVDLRTEAAVARLKQTSPSSLLDGKTGERKTVDSFRLPVSARARALMTLVIVPYIKTKLDCWYMEQNSLQPHEIPAPTPQDSTKVKLLRKLRVLFLRFYPFLNAGFEGVMLLFQLRYLFSTNAFFTPFLQLIGQRIQRLSMEDMTAMNTRQQRLAQDAQRGVAGYALERAWHDSSLARTGPFTLVAAFVKAMTSDISRILANYARWGLLLGIFFFKFLEWFYSNENALQRQTKLPIPRCPPITKPHPQGIPVAKSGICAICNQERKNSASAPSGYVFCYPCIFQHVQLHHNCPITMLHCDITQIRKIYDNN